MVVAMFRDSASSAITAAEGNDGNNGAPYPIIMTYYDDANNTSATTYKLRFGVTNGGTARLLQRYGAASIASMVIWEIAG